jgi:hypothetical protein
LMFGTVGFKMFFLEAVPVAPTKVCDIFLTLTLVF